MPAVRQEKHSDRKDAINPSLEARAAPPWRGRFTLLSIPPVLSHRILFAKKVKTKRNRLNGLFHPLGMENTVFISTFVSMRTKVIALSLNQVGWQHG